MKVKLCGVASVDALRIVGAARPDAVGFVLAESPRQVTLDLLAQLLAMVPDSVQRWAVFRTPDADTVRALASMAITGVQGHADWNGEGLAEHQAFLPVLRDGPDVVEQARTLGFRGQGRDVEGLVGAMLLDGPSGGGKGVRADVGRAKALAALGPLVLAGGMRPGNVAEAIAAVRPYAVDVSSGIEASPAVKDAAKVQAFVAAARQAS